jgi:hypothetical protein
LYGTDPYGFVLNMFEWGKPYSFLAKHERPYDFQCEILEDMTKSLAQDPSIYRLGISAGKGIGKTALLSMLFLWHVMTHRYSRSNLLGVTGDAIDQRIWAEIGQWFDVCKARPYFKRYRGGRIVHVYHDTWFGAYQLWQGNLVETLHGSHAPYLGYFVDEACGVPNQVLDTIESGAVDEHVTIIYISNPTRLRSRFKQCFEGGTFAHLWHTWQIDSRTTERHNPARVQELLDEEGGNEDASRFRINVRGLFPLTDSEQFIGATIVQKAQQRMARGYENMPACIGVDVARQGRNKSVFILRQGCKIVDMKVMSQQHTDVTAFALIDFIDKHRALRPIAYIDIVGYGAGVFDICERFGYKVEAVNSALPAVGPHKEQFANRRMELWHFTKEWLRIEGCLDPREVTLAQQLTEPSAFVNATGKLQLEGKEQMQARGVESPDEADALTYSFGDYQAYQMAGVWGRRPEDSLYTPAREGGYGYGSLESHQLGGARPDLDQAIRERQAGLW